MISFSIYAAFHYAVWLFNPFPNELREGISLEIVSLMAKGINPFSNESPDSFFYVYGFVGSWLITLLQKIFGEHGFILHRFVSLLCILVSAGLVEMQARRISDNRFPKWLAFLMMLSSGWIFSSELIARPDHLALLIYILTVVLLVNSKHAFSCIIAALLTVLTFYTKQYFILMSVPMFLGMLMVNMRLAFIYGFAFAGFFLGSLFAVQWIYPHYFPMAFLTYGILGSSSSLFHLVKQMAVFSLFYWPLLLFVTIGLILLFRNCSIIFSGFTSLNKPFFKIQAPIISDDRRMTVIIFYCALFFTTSLILCWIGTNQGAILSYFYQLLLMPIIILTSALYFILDNRERRQKQFLYAVCIFSLIHLGGFYNFTKPLSNNEKLAWRDAEALLAQSGSNICILSPLFVKYALNHNVIDFDPGHDYGGWLRASYRELEQKQSPIRNLFPNAKQLIEKYDRYIRLRAMKVNSGAFDLLVTDQSDGLQSTYKLGYVKIKKMQLRTGGQTLGVDFWKRKKASPSQIYQCIPLLIDHSQRDNI